MGPAIYASTTQAREDFRGLGVIQENLNLFGGRFGPILLLGLTQERQEVALCSSASALLGRHD